MTLPVVLSAEVQTLSGSTWTVTIPSSSDGDLIYVTLNCNAGTGVQNVVTPPSGWTQVFDSDLELTGNGWQEAWYIVRGAGTPAGDFTMLASRAGRAHVMVVDAGTFDSTTVIEDVAKGSQSSSTSWAIPAVDAAGDALLVAATACAGSGPTWTPDPAYTERTDEANGTTSSMGTGTRAISGGTGLTATWTPSAADNGTTSHVVIKGAGAGGTSTYDTAILAHAAIEAYYPLATSGEDTQGTADGVAVDVTFGSAAIIASADTKDRSATFNGVSGGVIPSGSAQYVDEVTADTPIAWWRMGEASGDVLDEIGTADGAVTGSVTRDAAGLLNANDDDGAIDFAGGRVSMTVPAIGAEWVIEAWIEPDAFPGNGNIIFTANSTANAPELRLDAGDQLEVAWQNSSGVNNNLIGSTLAAGTRYHVAAVSDGSTVRLYLNGQQDASVTQSSKNYSSSFSATIGATSTGSLSFDGTIDEVAVYGASLTATRLLAHHDAGVGGQSQIPVLGDTWSVELWVVPTAATLSTREYFISAHTGSTSVLSLWRYDDGKTVLSWNDSTDTGHSIGNTILGADAAFHVVATHDGTTGTLVINGVVQAEAVFDSRAMDALTWKLGGWSVSDQLVLAGRMQKVAIYSAALSIDDIRDHYELGTGGVVFHTVDTIAPAAQSAATATLVYSATAAPEHAEPEVGGTVETTESALSAVGKSVALSWDVRAAVGKSLDIAYQLLAGAGDVATYDEASLVFDDESGTYDGEVIVELTAVGRDLAISYNVLTSVGKSVALSYNVRVAVGRDLVLRYQVLAIITPERAARFEIDWDGSGFELIPATEDISFSWRRGAGPDLDSQSPSSATLVLHNIDDKYTDTNTSSPLYTRIRPNARFRASVDFSGTFVPVWAGYLSDMAPNVDIPEVDLVFDDLLHRLSTIEVDIEPEEGRTFGEYRQAVLEAAGVPSIEMDLDDENEVMVDTADYGSGIALSLLEAVNTATGTRHFIRPGAGDDPWQQYVTVNRQHKLTQPVVDIDISADGGEIETGSDGWRTAWDTVINRQRMSVRGEVQYPNEPEEIWVADNMPLWIPPDSSLDVWALNTGPIRDMFALVFGPGIVTQDPTAYADSVKITILAGSGGATVTSIAVWGRPGTSGSNETVTEENAVSIAAYGRKDGPTRSAVGSLISSATGTAEHFVWRYGEPRKQPNARFSNPEQGYLGRDLFDLVAFSMSRVFVSDRRMELIGEEGSIQRSVIRMTWQLQDTPEQDPSDWFVLNTSALNSTAILGY